MLFLGLRIHRCSVADRSLRYLEEALIGPLKRFVAHLENRVAEAGDGLPEMHLLIAYDAADQMLSERMRVEFPQRQLIACQPWGFSLALNALLSAAAKLCHSNSRTSASSDTGPHCIGFISTEIQLCSANVLPSMLRLITNSSDVLVVGHALSGSHQFEPEPLSQQPLPLTGLRSLWNTLAIWRLDWLAATGFMAVSDHSGA